MSWSDFSFRPSEWIGLGGKQATAKSERGAETLHARPERAPLESAASIADRRIRVIDASQGEASYDYLTRDLNLSQLAKIEEEVGKVSEKQINDLMQMINVLDYESMESKSRGLPDKEQSYPHIALSAVKKGRMSEAEFTNVMFYWSIRETGRESGYGKQVKITNMPPPKRLGCL